MARDDVLARALPLNAPWSVYGTDERRGITVEGLKLGADTFGPRDCSFVLQRDPQVAFDDLQAATPIEFEIGGSKLWAGRTRETPTSEVNRQISVTGEGWQYHLDDDDYFKTYIHTSLKDWGDTRQIANTGLGATQYGAQGTVQTTDDGFIYIGQQTNVALPVGLRTGVTLDLGPLNSANYCSITITSSNNTPNHNLYVRAMTVPQFGNQDSTYGFCDLGMGSVNASNPVATNNGFLGGPGAASGGFAVPVRYISIFDYVNTAYTPGADVWWKVQIAFVATSQAYQSSGTSVLFASTVIKDALTHAPLLSTDQSLIQSTAFAIPELVATAWQTPRDAINAVNAYHAYQFRIRADLRPEFRPQPTSPLLTAIGGTFEDTSAGSLDQVYNRCVGQATGPDGVLITSDQQSTGSIPSRRGYKRTNALNTNISLTQTALDQLCTTFLSAHGKMPFKGTYTAGGYDSVQMTVGGARVPAWELLQYVGELIHFPNMVDPDTGAKGRDGRISAVSYDHDSRTASVSIDSQRSNFEALLARLQVVAGQVA